MSYTNAFGQVLAGYLATLDPEFVLPEETFTVIAYDLNTNARLCELPGNNLTFDSRLNDSGSITLDLSLSDPDVAAVVAPILGYGGNPFAIYVDMNGVIVWGGIAWTGNYTRSTGVLEVGGKEFLSYFDQRLAVRDYSALTYPSGVDPALLIGRVFTDTQAAAGAGSSIGLGVVAAASSIPPIIPGYPTSQQTQVSSIMSDIVTAVTPGYGTVDVYTECQYDTNGNPTRTAYVKSPRAGRAGSASGLIFDLTDVIDFTWPTDASQSGNNLTVVGSGTGSTTPTATAIADVPLGGLGQAPRLDLVITTTATTQSLAASMAHGAAAQYGKPIRTPTVTVLASGAQPLGSWIMGDDARLTMPSGDERFPNGVDSYWRIVQASVTVPDSGPAVVTLTFNTPPVY